MDGDVQVQMNGTGHTSLSIAFPIDVGAPSGDPPDIFSINPVSGPAGGFTVVTITGTGFTGVSSVKFGATEALSFSVDSPTQITAETPPGPVFTSVNVIVQDADGSDTLPSGFFYNINPPPSISTVTPNSGTMLGDARVTITGSSVVGVNSVTFGGVAGTDLEVASPTELTVATPPGAQGLVNVTAFNSVSSSTITNGYEYTDPGQFINIGPGVGGLIGPSQLSGNGDLAPGSQTGFSVVLANALAGQLGSLFVSLGQGAAPFKGGTFYPIPVLLQISIGTDALGGFAFSSSMPLGTPPGTALVMQTWTGDFTAPALFTGSNGLKAIVP
jgi:hypothetical protein